VLAMRAVPSDADTHLLDLLNLLALNPLSSKDMPWTRAERRQCPVRDDLIFGEARLLSFKRRRG